MNLFFKNIFEMFSYLLIISSFSINIFFIYTKFLKAKMNPRIKKILIGPLISIIALFLILFLLEFYFRFFVIQSDGLSFTKSSQLWFSKYWHPVNSYGYRDKEHSDKELNGKKIILIVGDSFVAGHGIKNPSLRFSDLLQKYLGDDWVVINIANNGWQTRDEYEGLVTYPSKPDVIILSHYIDDIVYAAQLNKFPPPPIIKNLPLPTRIIINTSYFANFLYWQKYRLESSFLNKEYERYLKEAYLNTLILKTHEEELNKFVKYSREQNSKLLLVLFPSLVDVPGSAKINSIISSWSLINKIPVLNMGEKLAGKSSHELIVNQQDAHPNELVHQEVANFLLEYIKQFKLI